MNDEAPNNAIPVEPEPRVGPGAALREAREAHKLTRETVAKQLRIDDARVRALEEDDYSKFAAPIYVTGHLRAYARLLGLAPESFIETYQNLGVAPPPSLERVAHLQTQPEPIGTKQVPKWMLYFMVAAVVAAVALVWRSEVVSLLLPIFESPLTPEVPLQGVPGGTAHSGGEGTATQQALTLPSLPMPEETMNPPVSGPASAAPETLQAAAPPPPVLPRAHLSLKAEKPSWVEVKDGNGERLFYDLMVPGDEKSLQGVPPFDILLGYAPGVIVKYNGKRVDQSMYAGHDVARFRVSDSGISKN